MSKKVILSVLLLLVFAFTGIAYAAEKPIGEVTSTQQVIDKLYTGRTLDPIEGIWVRDDKYVIAIVKTSLVKTEDPKYTSSDYIGIYIKGSKSGKIFIRISKTEYSFAFRGKGDYDNGTGYWKLLSPTVLQWDGDDVGTYCFPAQAFVRIYPTS